MVNLLEETKEILDIYGLTPSDVRWVGSSDGKYSIEWWEFERISNFEYDDYFGSQEIADDLVVVGDTWWLERFEYDGSENWVYKTIPVEKETQPFDKVKVSRISPL